ncbi:MAG TPA: prolipoprotein diacylglyceryl transferase family protein, partial [Longimicrobiales bacterium]
QGVDPRLGDSRDRALPLTDPPAVQATTPAPASSRAGPLLYGTLFTVLLPLGLVLWARGSAGAVPLPALHSLGGGLALMALGLALWLAAVRELVMRGRGLPMNAYPPRERVGSGPYRFLAHPLYAGAALTALGAAVAAGSASGLWLVLPTLLLAMVALVLGYERADLLSRLGPPRENPVLSLPPDSPEAARLLDRANVYLLVLLPWVITYYGVQFLGIPADAFPLVTGAELRWPVLEWTYAIYASCYVMVPLVPLVLRTRSQLRRFALAGLLATALVGLLWLVVPVAAPLRPESPQSWLGRMLQLERMQTNGMAAFPAFHVLWALLAADALAGRSRAWAWVGWAWAVAITLSCVSTGMHALADVVAALAVFPLVRRPARSWAALRSATEALANSWREWRFGGVRVINHGAYAGLSGAVGWWLIASASAGQPRWAVAAVALAGLLGAGIWAQALEASSGLLRPFGYYGSVVGGLAGAVLAGAFGASTTVLLAATALAAPWMQAIGRARCLVQGCCHGGPAPDGVGIVYRHPRSRVVYLAELAGRPLHPTPLYSIVSNVVLGLVLLRLWSLGAPTTLVVGVYLIGNGLARFVEEAYRGEPQTPVLGRLRLYQWLAIAAV